MDLARGAQELALRHSPLGDRAVRKRVVHARRRVFEAVGSDRYSRPAHADLDGKLQRFLPASGIFLEAGANDGYTWSNTYYLERRRGWTGILVEGIPELAAECRRLRRGSTVVNCALVADDHPTPTVRMTYGDLRSLITDSSPVLERELATASQEEVYEVEVPARTLSDVIADSGRGRPDFISLDLEGFEASALRGLDLDRDGPEWLLVEALGDEARDAVEAVLGDRYAFVADLTGADLLYRRAGR